MHKENAINPLTQDDVSKIEGTSVYGNDDAKIGHISTELMDPSSKKIDRLVVSAGGVLGVGGHRVAIAVEQFSWDADKGAFKLGTTLAELKQMPNGSRSANHDQDRACRRATTRRRRRQRRRPARAIRRHAELS
jgi:hypothetical protein